MVDPAAGARFTGQAEIHLQSQTSLRSLAQGASIRVFVEDIGAGGSVVLRIGGQRVLATTPFPLRKGEWYVVRPQKVAGRLSLRLESQVSRVVLSAEIARSAGMPDDAISEAVVRAFLRTGLPLLPGRLQRAYGRVLSASRGRRRDAKEVARLESLAERKGLIFEDDILDLIGSLGGRGRSHGGDQPGDHAQPETNGKESGQSRPSNADGVRAAFRLSAEADHPIQLFNHVVGEGDHWVVVPIDAPGTDMHASLRIRIPRGYALGTDRNLPAVREAVLVVTTNESRWLFGLQPSGSGLHVVLLSRPDSSADTAHLAARLAEMGIRFDQGTLSARFDDGFSQTDAADIMTSVDSSV